MSRHGIWPIHSKVGGKQQETSFFVHIYFISFICGRVIFFFVVTDTSVTADLCNVWNCLGQFDCARVSCHSLTINQCADWSRMSETCPACLIDSASDVRNPAISRQDRARLRFKNGWHVNTNMLRNMPDRTAGFLTPGAGTKLVSTTQYTPAVTVGRGCDLASSDVWPRCYASKKSSGKGCRLATPWCWKRRQAIRAEPVN